MSPGPPRRLGPEDVSSVTSTGFVDTKIVAEVQEQASGDEPYTLVEDGSKKILLNFGRVPYCSSTVPGKLATLKRRIDAGKGKRKLCCFHAALTIRFKLTKLERVFEIDEGEQPARDMCWERGAREPEETGIGCPNIFSRSTLDSLALCGKCDCSAGFSSRWVALSNLVSCL